MPVNDPWSLNPDGTVSFDTPAGPLASFGPDAAVEMARRDAERGVQRPLSFYQQAARSPSMATSPQALAYAPEADGGMSRADAPPPPEASFQPPQLNASTEAPAAPPLGAAGAQGPALPEGWGKYAIDKPLKDTWAERKTLEGQPAADRIRYPSVGPNQGGAPEAAPPPAPAAEAQAGQATGRVDPASVVTLGPRPGAKAGGAGSGGKVFADARAALDESMRYQQGAVEASERSRLAGDARQAEVMREQNAIEATYQAAREERMRELHERTKQYEAKVSQTLADHDKMQVDPNRWMSSRTAGQRVLLTIGAFLSGFGGEGNSNQTLDLINKRIDNDIRAQVDNRDAKLKQASATQSLYRDYLATFKDHEEALLATATTAKLGIAKQAMAQALEIGSPEQIARAEELHAKLLEQQAGQYMHLAQQRAAAAAKGAGGPAKVKPPRQIMINGRSFEVRPNVTDAEYNKLAEEAQKVDRVYRTVEQASSDKSAPPGFFERLAASTLGYKTEAVIRAEANADSVQSADSQLSGEGTSSETAVKTGREKYGGPNKQAGLAEERKKADAAAIDLKRRATQ